MAIAIVIGGFILLAAAILFSISRASSIKQLINEDRAEREAADRQRANPVVTVPPLSISPQTSLPANHRKMVPGRQFKYDGRTYKVREDGIAETVFGDIIDFMLFTLIYDEITFEGDWSEPISYYPDDFAASMAAGSEARDDVEMSTQANSDEQPIQPEMAPDPVASEPTSTPEPSHSSYSNDDHSSHSSPSYESSSHSYDSGSHSSYDSGSSSSFDSGGGGGGGGDF